MRLRRLFGRDPGSVEDGAREDEDAAGAQSATDGVDEPAVSADLDDEDSGRGVTDDLGDDPATDGGTDTSEAPEGGPARGEPPAPRAVNVGAEDLDEGSADDGEPTTDPGLVDRARDEPGADAVGADDGTADADTGDDATSDDRAVADAGTADAGTADAGTSDDRAVADAGRGDAELGAEELDADDDGAADEGGSDADRDSDEDEDDVEPTGQIEFELSDWGTRERKLLDESLTAMRVRKAWEAGTLVVAAADADVVDDLIDEVEERTALDLPPDVDPVIYDVGDWPAGLEDRFIERLIEERLPHMRGYREIAIGVDDEERVDALIEDVTSAWEDEQADDELGGPDAQEVLSELFVSADRLLHDASDRAATVRFGDAAEVATEMAVPFGFADTDWTAITDRVVVLRDLLGEAGSIDDDIVEAASELRSHLRPLV